MSKRTMRKRKLLAVGVAALGVSALAPAGAFAQGQYPMRPIRLVVPFSPGGVMDAVGRLWAEHVRSTLGTIIVDNRGGAGGTIGSAEVARAAPDGYTVLLGNTSTQIINPVVMKKVPYNPQKDFETVDMVAISVTSIVVHPSTQVTSLKQLIAYAKKHPGDLSYGSAGVGTLTNLAGEMFKKLGGNLDIVHVPYKGSGPGLIDLTGGYIPMMTPTITAQVLSLHRSKRVRILSVNGPPRLKAAPEIPTSSETGPGLVAQLYRCIFGRAGTPREIVGRISQATRKALGDPKFQELLTQSGFEPVLDSSPQKAQAFLEEERRRLLPVIQSIDLGKK
jgi:tripartite-type tricarboxylate transporter receptor subunit TctC